MSSTKSGKRLRTNSIGESVVTRSSSAPTPPPHSTVYPPSPLSGSNDSRSTTSTNASRRSVIQNKSGGPRVFHYPVSTATPSTFGTSQTSSVPLDFSSLESSEHLWSPSSSSFQSSSFHCSSATLNESTSSKKPRYPNPEGPARPAYQRDLRNVQTPVTSHAANAGFQSYTTPSIPGYGPIRVTVSLDLPPLPTHNFYPTHGPTPTTTPSSEVPPNILPHGELETALDFLSDAEIRQLLRLAVRKHPDFGEEVRLEYSLKAQAERSKTINFVQYSNNAWHTLNTKYNFMDGEKQYDMASQAVEDVSKDIGAIVKEVKRESSLGTKKSAIETLRKIGRSICLSTGIIGDKVREWIGDATFVDGMMDIISLLTNNDKRELRQGNDGELVSRLEQLDELRQYYGVFERFDEVVRALKSNGHGNETSGVSILS